MIQFSGEISVQLSKNTIEPSFFGKGSETAKTAEETNISTKIPNYEYYSEPLREHRRFDESGDFEEKDSEKKTEKLIQLLNNI